MRERILQLLEEQRLASSAFAEKIGVQASSISHLLSGRNNPSFEFIQKVLTAYPDINADWLIMGKGSMHVNHTKEISDYVVESKDEIPENKDLFTLKAPTANSKSDKPSINSAINPNKSIFKVITLYMDGTFDEYIR